MPQRRKPFTDVAPFLAWMRLATHAGEMLTASTQVIQYRTGRMLAAGVLPNTHDRREFILMGQEKLEAASESMQAMALQMVSVNMLLADAAWRQWVRNTQQMMTLFGNPLAASAAQMQSAMLPALGADAAALASKLAGAATSVVHHGLRPIHARATGNARRLRKR